MDVRLAARALAGAGLVHAYGHCSTRIDAERFLVSAPMPLALAAENSCIVCPVAGSLPDGVLGEVRVHQAIYAARSEIGAVCRIMPPALMALSTQGIVPRPRHGIGAYFPDLPLWDDPRLLRDDAAAKRLATNMGTAPAIVMGGTAPSSPRAIFNVLLRYAGFSRTRLKSSATSALWGATRRPAC